VYLSWWFALQRWATALMIVSCVLPSANMPLRGLDSSRVHNPHLLCLSMEAMFHTRIHLWAIQLGLILACHWSISAQTARHSAALCTGCLVQWRDQSRHVCVSSLMRPSFVREWHLALIRII